MSNKEVQALNLGGERKRVDPFLKGIQEGAIKKGIDTVSGKVSLPMAEAISAKLQEMHPNMALTAPMVQSGMQAMIILGMAELLDVAGPHISGSVGSKAALGSQLMRRYAGEKVGADIVESAMQFLPVIMAAFSEMSEEDMMNSLTDGEGVENFALPEGEHEYEIEDSSSIEDLFIEDDEDEEILFVQAKEPVVVEPEAVVTAKRKPRKRRVSKSSE